MPYFNLPSDQGAPPLVVTFEDQLYQPADTNSKLGASAYHLLQRCLWLVPDRVGRLSQSMLHGGFVGTRLPLWGRSLPDGLVARLSILGYFPEHQWRNVLGALPGLRYIWRLR